MTELSATALGWASAEDHGELCISLYAGARCRTAQVQLTPAFCSRFWPHPRAHSPALPLMDTHL